MKILLAVDGSKYTKKMLAYLVMHSEMFSANNDFTVFNAQVPVPPNAGFAVGSDVVKSFHAEEAEKVIAPVCKFLTRHGIDAKSAWKVGAAGPVIAKFSEAGKFDLLVLGSHGHGALVNLVMGSVATQVLAGCKTPVLIVR
jgi:nucleotide-binding universal stress UspA family protein